MDVIIQKQYKIEGMPGIVTISDDDVLNAAAPFPATVSFDQDTAFLHFDSPLAAADFVNSLEGQVPYKIEGMSAEDEFVFNDPSIRPANKSLDDPNINMIDKRARHWGVAAFCVACSGAGIAIAAFALSLIGIITGG